LKRRVFKGIIKTGEKNKLMDRIRDFFKTLENRKALFIWICAAVILLSLLRFSLWATRKSRATGPRAYMKQLHSSSPQEKKYALYTLGQTGVKSAIPEIEQIVKEEPDVEIKRVAAWSLGTLDKEKLIAVLDSPQKEVKYIVMETLMKLDKKNIGFLVERFPGEDAETKQKILSYMESAGPSVFHEELIRIAEKNDEDRDVRKRCLEMLKTIDISDIENRLWNLYYNDADEEIKKIAYDVIQGKNRK